MDNDPKKNDDDDDDAYPKPGEIRRLDADLYPDVERIKKLVDPDDTPVRPEQLSNLAQRPEFQPNDDIPTAEYCPNHSSNSVLL
jgi:hypothetical protein